jgi:hypothetical protein
MRFQLREQARELGHRPEPMRFAEIAARQVDGVEVQERRCNPADVLALSAAMKSSPSSCPGKWLRRATPQSGSSTSWVLFGVAIAAFLTVAVHQLWLVGDYRVDDAYITFSFSKNLATGHGPVYSHDLRVEGYSNFLWMVLTALGLFVTRSNDPYSIARVLAVLAIGVTAFSVYRAVWRSSGTWAALLATAFLLCCTDLFRGAISGLETAAFVSALALGWHCYLGEHWPLWRWSLLAFLPVSLLRIDGFVPVIVVLAFEFFYALVQQRFTFSRMFRWAAPMLAIWAAYFAWRWYYYGLPLPAPYYAKSLATAHDPNRGANLFRWFLRDYDLVVLVPILLAALLWGPRSKVVALLLAVTFQCAYVTRVGGDWMPFHRFFLPVVPLVAIICGWGTERLWSRVSRLPLLVRWPLRLGTLCAIAHVALRMHAGYVDGPEERGKLRDARNSITHTHKNLLRNADLMRHVLRRPGERLATDYAGVFAVETDAEIIDMWGLCNADIALNGGAEGINPEYGKECSKCYAQLQPDYFHVVVPIVRSVNSFSNVHQVIGEVFQGRAIDRVIDLTHKYAVGRVVEESTGRALWFLERKRASMPRQRRNVAPGIRVEYPFE